MISYEKHETRNDFLDDASQWLITKANGIFKRAYLDSQRIALFHIRNISGR